MKRNLLEIGLEVLIVTDHRASKITHKRLTIWELGLAIQPFTFSGEKPLSKCLIMTANYSDTIDIVQQSGW